MSASITRSVVRKQLCAMGCELFDLGILQHDGRMLLREGWSAEQIDAALSWLKRRMRAVRTSSSDQAVSMR